ncbi:MAG: ferric reductase-like transmembrane domain-containing protein, partial [Gemmatimonadales bacterium]
VALRGPHPLVPAALVAHVTGMLAGYGVAVLIALMSRTPAFERGVGADVLARWHGRGGRIVLTLALVHAWAAASVWAGSRRESFATGTWHLFKLPWLISATVGTALLVLVAVVSIRSARRRISHERWHNIHLLVYLGVAMVFMHQLAGPDLVGHRVLQVLWALMYTSVFALVLQYRLIVPVRNATRHRLRVQAIVPEGPGVVSVIIAGQRLDELRAEAGQFFRWRFLTPDLWKTAHPFSLSAPATPTHLRLTVKALGDGSTKLQHLEPGTWVIAEGPYGAITAERRTCRDVLLIAGGVGITPMRALFEAMPVAPGQDLLLLYRARTVDDVIFRAELEHIARARGARLQYLLSDRVGPMTPALFLHLVPNLAHRDVYLCGPPTLAGAVRAALLGAGLPHQQLHEERFDL